MQDIQSIFNAVYFWSECNSRDDLQKLCEAGSFVVLLLVIQNNCLIQQCKECYNAHISIKRGIFCWKMDCKEVVFD